MSLPQRPHLRWLRLAIAAVWLATALLVLFPGYRAVGGRYLDLLGLPLWLMWAACGGELFLGLWLLRRPMDTPLIVLQIALVCGFTAVLAVLEPMLLVHPLGVLSKNLPFVGVIVVIWRVQRRGFGEDARSWDEATRRWLRLSMALVWFTEGIFPKLLFQQPWELQLARRMGLPGDPAMLIFCLGVAQVVSGVAVLTLRGRPRQVVLLTQIGAIVALSLIVSLMEPRFLVHPFGPLTKNIPLIVGTCVVVQGCSSTR